MARKLCTRFGLQVLVIMLCAACMGLALAGGPAVRALAEEGKAAGVETDEGLATGEDTAAGTADGGVVETKDETNKTVNPGDTNSDVKDGSEGQTAGDAGETKADKAASEDEKSEASTGESEGADKVAGSDQVEPESGTENKDESNKTVNPGATDNNAADGADTTDDVAKTSDENNKTENPAETSGNEAGVTVNTKNTSNKTDKAAETEKKTESTGATETAEAKKPTVSAASVKRVGGIAKAPAASTGVQVTIQHYRQNADGSWPTEPNDTWITTKNANDTLKYKDEAAREMGTAPESGTFNTAYTGFRASTTHSGYQETFTVTSDPLQNVFKIYYERGLYRLHYQYYTADMKRADSSTGYAYGSTGDPNWYVKGDASYPTTAVLQNDPQWTNTENPAVGGVYYNYFEQNTTLNGFAPIFTLNDGSRWQLRQWHAESLVDDPTSAEASKYKLATFNGTGNSITKENIDSVLWYPSTSLGVYQVEGP